MSRILVVDDNPVDRLMISRILEDDGNLVTCAESGEEAWSIIQERQPDIVVTDILMPGMSGIELAELIRVSYPHVGIAIITGGDVPTVVAPHIAVLCKRQRSSAIVETVGALRRTFLPDDLPFRDELRGATRQTKWLAVAVCIAILASSCGLFALNQQLTGGITYANPR